MGRKHNTDKNGMAWSETTKKAIWNKGRIIPNLNADSWRRDKCGFPMKYTE